MSHIAVDFQSEYNSCLLQHEIVLTSKRLNQISTDILNHIFGLGFYDLFYDSAGVFVFVRLVGNLNLRLFNS